MSRSRSRSPRGRAPAGDGPSSRAYGANHTSGGFTVWVGGLPDDIREDDIHDKFGKFGKILDVRLKAAGSRGPPFAFVEFKDKLDADDCVKDMDAKPFGSQKIAVQSSGDRAPRRDREPPRGRGDSRGRGGRRADSRGRAGGRDHSRGAYNGGPNAYRGSYYDKKDMGKDNHKITLEGIPHDMTWTELKELGKQHSSRPGEVTFARTFRNRSNLACGILEFRSKSIAEDVIDKLNGRKIKGHDDRLDVKMGDLSRGNY